MALPEEFDNPESLDGWVPVGSFDSREEASALLARLQGAGMTAQVYEDTTWAIVTLSRFHNDAFRVLSSQRYSDEVDAMAPDSTVQE
jgi:hypothetical protein